MLHVLGVRVGWGVVRVSRSLDLHGPFDEPATRFTIINKQIYIYIYDSGAV